MNKEMAEENFLWFEIFFLFDIVFQIFFCLRTMLNKNCNITKKNISYYVYYHIHIEINEIIGKYHI